MAEAVVSIVVGRLTDLLTEEAQLVHGVKDEIEQVVSELQRMKTFLRDADSRISVSNIRKLVADIREIAYEAEHVVETFLLKASSTRKIIKWMNTKKFSRNIKDVQRKMSFLFNRFRDYNIISTSESPESSVSRTPEKLKIFYNYPINEPDIFVGFQEDVDCLVGHLVNEGDDCHRLISICGMGGLGKTTLAQKIYNHSKIKTYFAGLAWVSISQKWQAKHVLQRILTRLVPEKENEILTFDSNKLVENLIQIQQTKKCLIVLDDIWTTEAWDSLKAAFTAENSMSKILLTSRNVNVAEHVNPKGLIHRPQFLNPEQSWELLQLKALPTRGEFLDSIRDVRRMEELGREMLRKCAGLPLAIVILGGILVTKPSLIEWEKVYHDSLSSPERGNGFGDPKKQIFDVLVWSYNDLPPQLKPCFLYLGKFCEDEWIEAETLYQLWIAEGMVLSSDKNEGETKMQVAESYMGELVHRSMVKGRFKYMESSPTKIEYCCLHDLMRDLSLLQAKAEDFFEVIYPQENVLIPNPSLHFTSADTRQLVIYLDKRCTSKETVSYFIKKATEQGYRSMLIFHENTLRSLPPVLESHVANFRLLRVFLLEKVKLDVKASETIFGSSLGKVLGNLVYLRYLSISNTNLLNFPSIQKLVLLQTLKLDTHKHMDIPRWLSRDILGKLRRLQHLCLPDGKVDTLGRDFKLRFIGLNKLETLENFDTNWCEVKDLQELISLRKLSVRVHSCYDLEELMKYLAARALPSASCLVSLDISIHCNLTWENGPDLLRQLLWKHRYILQNLLTTGRLPELAQLLFGKQQLDNTHIDVSLIHITKLELWESYVEEDPMPVLEKLPTLRDLYLVVAYVGREMVCSATGFPKLTILTLVDLPNFEKWRVQEGSMPILENLTIDSCRKLEELPEGLRFLNSLETLLLCSMPSEFNERVRVVNGKPGPDFSKVTCVRNIRIHNETEFILC